MRVGKILAISVVSLAGLIVLGAVVIAAKLFYPSRVQQNFVPPDDQKIVSPAGSDILISQKSGDSSFLYQTSASSGKKQRLTSAPSGLESEASFSHDGKLVVYSYASSLQSKSSVWIVGADGRNPHAITKDNEDALHPVFSPDDSKVFYAASNFTGHHSPIVAPARHDWDVFSIPISSDAAVAGATPAQVTHASFYALQSVDVSAGDNPSDSKILISTTGYPIGDLIEEFYLGATGRDKIFQPHVPGEPTVAGPAFGEARYIHKGMDILFLAATGTSGGNYDYNVISMSDVTGSEIKQLTHLKGMTTDLRVSPNGNATLINGGAAYVLNVATQAARPL
jgi:hypothetical protein